MKGLALVHVAEEPKAKPLKKDRPADPERLAALVAAAGNGAGLGHLRLDAPPCEPGKTRNGSGVPCKACKHRAVCALRVAAGLWAVCERPWENDLIVLNNILWEKRHGA